MSTAVFFTLLAGACLALSSFFAAALGAFAALGRWLEERDVPAHAGLSGFLLRDAATLTSAWLLASLLLALSAPLLVLRSGMLIASTRTMLLTLLVSAVVWIITASLWARRAEAAPRRYTIAAAVLSLPFYFTLLPLRRLLGSNLVRLYPPYAQRAGHLLSMDKEELSNNGELSRLLDQEEREMIQRVFDLSETVVREMMVPRIDMVCIEESTPIADLLRLLREKRHSRIPVYRERIDNIVGFLHIKDLVRQAEELQTLQLQDIIRPAHFVPETKRADDLLSDMRARRIHLAIVVDEYGGTAGLVTLEDVIEEVVGEIQDETDKEQPLLVRLADGSLRVDAKIDLDDLNERLEVTLPAAEYDTLGGFLYSLAGRIPQPGDRFTHRGMEFVISGVRGKRITQVLVRKSEAAVVEELPGGRQ
jgi:CBS domain containing-hemolysin-like protein